MHPLTRPVVGPATADKVGLAMATGAAVSVVFGGLVDGRALPPVVPAEFWVLAGLAVVADVRPFAVPGATRRATPIFLSICFTFAIMLLWGPGPAIAVQTISVVGAGVGRRMGPARTLLTAARMGLALIAASTVLSLFGPPALALGVRLSRGDVLAVISAGAAWFVVNYVLLAVGIRVLDNTTWRHVFTRTFAHELLSTGALLLLAPLLISAPTAWVIVLVLVPVIAVSQMARLSGEQQEQIRFDPLSGLLSRRALAAEVNDLTARVARHGAAPAVERQFALLLLDLDRFKNVNDALGHAVGDRLLAHVARRLAAAVRPGDLVARLGGDEFAVVAFRVADVEHARSIALRLAQELAQPADLDGLSLDVSASIGVAIHPLHGNDFATLMRHADVAMYVAKQRGAPVAVYSPRSDHHSVERLSLLTDLRRALEDPDRANEITLHYQPQVDIGTGDVVGVEALLRWHHPDRGLVSPEELVRIAEHSAVMLLLTFRVIDDTVAQLARWHAMGVTLRASINVSVRDLHTSGIVDHLRERLRRDGVSAKHIEVEITETALMADPRRVLATVHQLADLGVGLSLDDFGTGYSSLQHLRRLPLSELKIDRSFVQTMADDADNEAIVRSTIEMSHALGLRVVAEGVEDDAVGRLLGDAGCDVGQGWHYGRPMPADALTSWLTRRRRPGGGDTSTISKQPDAG